MHRTHPFCLMIQVTTDFECGNGKNFQKLDDGRFRLEVEADKQTGYGSYFCFDLVNEGPAVDVTVELCEDPRFGGPTTFGRVFPTTIWIKPVEFHRFRPLRGQYPECIDGRLTFTVPVEAEQRLRVAMTYVAPYSEVSASLQAIADERSDRSTAFSLGQSVQGRDLRGLRAGTPGKPKIFCIAGQHPHEHAGVWGVHGIADFVSSHLPAAAAIREQLEVFVIPVVNPDGNAMGRNAFNAEGLDMYLAFGEHPEAPEPEAHESRLLWKWLTNDTPAVWMNFHAYTGWQLNSEFPFDGWYEVEDRTLFGDPRQRRLYDALCDALRLETDAPSTHERASIHRPTTLCYQMARRFDIPHAFYELNNGTAGKHAASRRAIGVFKSVAETLLSAV